MSFKTKVNTDFKACFLNNDEFSELITITPYGGTAKNIKAIVTRQRSTTDDQTQNRLHIATAEIWIANDATDGVAAIDKGQTKATFPVLEGGTHVSWVIQDVLHKDDGAWHLLCTR